MGVVRVIMENIDWQEITEELGEDRWRDDWINLPRQSRLLLSKLVQEDRFVSRDNQQIYYGPDSQIELYEASKIAYNSLMNPITIQPLDEVSYGLGVSTSILLAFPGIVGIWPMSVIGLSGSATDISGNGNHLTNNNAALFNGMGVFPYVSFNGTNQYLSRLDATQFDISGSELYIGDNNGLTLGLWFNASTLNSDAAFVTKFSGVSGYMLRKLYSNEIRATIGNGDSIDALSSSTAVADNDWHFAAMVFKPNDSLSVWLDDIKSYKSTGIKTIGNTATNFDVGVRTGSEWFSGDASMLFLAASAVPDASIQRYYETSRNLYNG